MKSPMRFALLLFVLLLALSRLVGCGGSAASDAAPDACAASASPPANGSDASPAASPDASDSVDASPLPPPPSPPPDAGGDFCATCAAGELCIDTHVLGVGAKDRLADGGSDDAGGAYYANGCFPMPACAPQTKCLCLLNAAGDFCPNGEAECAFLPGKGLRLRCAVVLP